MIIEQAVYNGDLIHKRFAYRFFKEKTSPFGDMVAFRAPMYVSDNLIDLEDSISKDYIFSDDAINFCWEVPNMSPVGAVAFQRYFNTVIANILGKFISKPIEVNGDDIMIHEKFIGSDKVERETGKASVSITYSKEGIALGHTGINIKAGKKAPGHAFSTNLTDEQAQEFMEIIAQFFYMEVRDIFVATTKISI